jgi:hypothetical protein
MSSGFKIAGNRGSVRVAAQSPCRTSQTGRVPLVEGVEVQRVRKRVDGGERPFLYLGSHDLIYGRLLLRRNSCVPGLPGSLGRVQVGIVWCHVCQWTRIYEIS